MLKGWHINGELRTMNITDKDYPDVKQREATELCSELNALLDKMAHFDGFRQHHARLQASQSAGDF